MKSENCCEMPSWIVFADVIIRLKTLPGETLSIMEISCANRARMYASRKADDIRIPLMQMQNRLM